jgi:transposase-like protein
VVRKKYSDEYKNAVIGRYLRGDITQKALAENVGISVPTLSKWLKTTKWSQENLKTKRQTLWEDSQRPWKIVQGVHQGGTDKKKRYWVVPMELRERKLRVGDEAVVYTKQGLGRIKITWVTNSQDRWLRYLDKHGRPQKIEVREKVVLFYDD